MKKVFFFVTIIVGFYFSSNISAFSEVSKEQEEVNFEEDFQLDSYDLSLSFPIINGRFLIIYDKDVVDVAIARQVGETFNDIDSYYYNELGYRRPTSIQPWFSYPYYVIKIEEDIPGLSGRCISGLDNTSHIELSYVHILNNSDSWLSTAAHEYFHAIMRVHGIPYKTSQEMWMHEAFASWAGLNYADSHLGLQSEQIKERYFLRYMGFVQSHAPLYHYERCDLETHDNCQHIALSHQCNSFIYPQYLESEFGLDCIKDIVSNYVYYKNYYTDIDGPIDVINEVLKTRGTTFEDSFENFCIALTDAANTFSSPSYEYRKEWIYPYEPLDKIEFFENTEENYTEVFNLSDMTNKRIILNNLNIHPITLNLEIEISKNVRNVRVVIFKKQNGRLVLSQNISCNSNKTTSLSFPEDNSNESLEFLFINSSSTNHVELSISYFYQELHDYSSIFDSSERNVDYARITLFDDYLRYVEFDAIESGVHSIAILSSISSQIVVYEKTSHDTLVEIYALTEYNNMTVEVSLSKGKTYLIGFKKGDLGSEVSLDFILFKASQVNSKSLGEITINESGRMYYKYNPTISGNYSFVFNLHDRIHIALYDSQMKELTKNKVVFDYYLNANTAYYVMVFCSREYVSNLIILPSLKNIQENSTTDEFLLEQGSEAFAFIPKANTTYKIEIQSTMPIKLIMHQGKSVEIPNLNLLTYDIGNFSYPYNYVYILESINTDAYLLTIRSEDQIGLFTFGIYSDIERGSIKTLQIEADTMYHTTSIDHYEVLRYVPTNDQYYRIESWSDFIFSININGVENILKSNEQMQYPTDYKYYIEYYFLEGKDYIIQLPKNRSFYFTINSGDLASLRFDANKINYHFIHLYSYFDIKPYFDFYLFVLDVDYTNYTVVFDFVFAEFLAEEGTIFYDMDIVNFTAGLIIGETYPNPLNSLFFNFQGVRGEGCIYYSEIIHNVSVTFSEQEFKSYCVLNT